MKKRMLLALLLAVLIIPFSLAVAEMAPPPRNMILPEEWILSEDSPDATFHYCETCAQPRVSREDWQDITAASQGEETHMLRGSVRVVCSVCGGWFTSIPTNYTEPHVWAYHKGPCIRQPIGCTAIQPFPSK